MAEIIDPGIMEVQDDEITAEVEENQVMESQAEIIAITTVKRRKRLSCTMPESIRQTHMIQLKSS